jgi:hypothetical protein
MQLGKIVSASSHMEYICQIHGPAEADPAPTPRDYGFGTYVAIQAAPEQALVGVIYNTTLLNPEFGNLGPRLSPEPELAIFSPDYLAEKVTLVSIYAIGELSGDPAPGSSSQGLPRIAAHSDAPVRALSEAEMRAFHGDRGGLRVAYLPMLAGLTHPLVPHLLADIVARLSALFPDQAARLGILAGNLAWKTRIQPVG